MSSITPTPCVDTPSAPSGLRAVSEVGDIAISWDRPPMGSCRVLKHNVYKGTAPGEERLVASVLDSVSTYYDEDVINGIRYYYRVSAENSVGEGPRCDAVVGRLLGPPTEALNLTLSTVNGSVTLRWEPPIGPGGDQLMYRALRGEARLDLDVIAEELDSLEYIDRDVELGTFYYYAVMSYCEYGDGPPSEVLRIKPVDLPSAPREFMVEPGDGEVKLSWTSPSSTGGSMLLGFRIYRGGSPATMTLLATKGPGDLSHVDTGLANGHQYIYYVTAFSDVGESPPSSALDAMPFTVPGRVTDLVAAAGDRKVTLTWTAPGDDGGRPITKYRVLAGETSGSLTLLANLGNVSFFDHTGLVNGVTCYYAVVAVNEAGEGPVSETVSAKPMGLPGQVRDLKATGEKGGILLEWAAPQDSGGATSLTYIISRDDPSETTYSTSSLVFKDTNVTVGTTYEYWIRATGPVGDGPGVGPVEATAVDVPGPVTDLTTIGADGEVRLTWSPPEDDGGAIVSEYIVKRGVFATGMVEVARVETPYYDDTGLENGKTYLFSVVAVNAVGAGTGADPVEGTPLGLPTAPGVFKATLKGKSVELTWARPDGSGRAPVTGYVILRAVENGEMVEIAQVGDATVYVDESVEKGHTYTYRIISKSDLGDGVDFANAEVKVPKDEPSPGFTGEAGALVIACAVLLSSYNRSRKRHPPDVE